MNKFLITIAGVLMFGCAAQEEAAKAYHPTDDVSAQSQGGKGFTADGSEVQLEAPEPVTETLSKTTALTSASDS